MCITCLFFLLGFHFRYEGMIHSTELVIDL